MSTENLNNQGGQPPADSGKPSGQQPPETPLDYEKWLASQDETTKKLLDSHLGGLKSALDKEREDRKKLEKAQREAAKDQDEAEQKRLIEQQEWQKLAEQRQAKIAEIEKQVSEMTPFKERVERYGKALMAHLETQRQGLPAHVLTLLDKLDPAEQLEYIAANAEALKPQQPPQQKPPAGVPTTPPPNGGNNQLTPEEKRKRAFSIRNL